MAKNSKKAETVVLKAEDVSFTYPQVSEPAIHDINFSLKSNSISMLIGPNGSGKSTLIRVFLGILKSSGKITFYHKGKEISQHDAHIGYVPQKHDIDTTIPITVSELLTLTVNSCARCKTCAESEVDDVLKKVSALDYKHKKIGDLSGGQLQRVILARALLHKPKLLILDEPEAGIDVQAEQFFYEVLRNLVDTENITALIATHEMEVVNAYADQVICINKTLVCAGSTVEALTPKTFKELYGMHAKPYHHSHNGNHKHKG